MGFHDAAQKMMFSIKDFFSKCDQIRRKLRIWSHILKKSLMENFIFCTVKVLTNFRLNGRLDDDSKEKYFRGNEFRSLLVRGDKLLT